MSTNQTNQPIRNFADLQAKYTVLAEAKAKGKSMICDVSDRTIARDILMDAFGIPESIGTLGSTVVSGKTRLTWVPASTGKGRKSNPTGTVKSVLALCQALAKLTDAQITELAKMTVTKSGNETAIRPFANLGKLASICQKDTVKLPTRDTFKVWCDAIKLAYVA